MVISLPELEYKLNRLIVAYGINLADFMFVSFAKDGDARSYFTWKDIDVGFLAGLGRSNIALNFHVMMLGAESKDFDFWLFIRRRPFISAEYEVKDPILLLHESAPLHPVRLEAIADLARKINTSPQSLHSGYGFGYLEHYQYPDLRVVKSLRFKRDET